MDNLLADRLAVQDVMVKYATSVDARDLDRYATCFLPDVIVNGYGQDVIKGRDGYVDYVRTALQNYGRTQHLLGNFVVELNGDEAHMRCYVQATHVLAEDPEKFLILYAIYDDQLVRKDGQWAIRIHGLEPIARERGGRVPPA